MVPSCRAFRPLLAASFSLAALLTTPRAQDVTAHAVLWRTPSRDASGSMPIGNGEVGCNVWCEPDGRLCFYVARTDSWSEASRLLKLGKVTVQVRRPVAEEPFVQRLDLRNGTIEVTWGEGERRVTVRLFVDAMADVVHLQGESARDEQIVVQAETWRTAPRLLQGEELKSSWTMHDPPADVQVEEAADVAVGGDDPRGGGPRHGFYHRNTTSVTAMTLARQNLVVDGLPAFEDPLLHRSFGLLMGGTGWGRGSIRDGRAPVLMSARGRNFTLAIAAPCVQDAAAGAFAERANALLDAVDPERDRERTAAWWRAFWARSYIEVRGDQIAGVPSNAHPLRIGEDSGGGNRFVGTIADVQVQDGDDVVFAAATTTLPQQVETLRNRPFHGVLRLAATVEQDAAHPIGRILDKVTAGRGDGFLFDTHPGRALRLIVGDHQLIAENVLTPGQSHRIAATFDPATSHMELWLDGALVKSSAPPVDPAPASRLTLALVLQRWIQACGGRGAFPIKFNGSIFTVEPQLTGGPVFNADWRKWGDCFWWQNTRLPYYPMLAQGDFDMQTPLFDFYRRTLAIAEQRARAWHGASGGYWPEVMTPFGTHGNRDYGWNRDGVPKDKVLCPWWEYARNQGLELLALLLDRYDYERDPAFFRAQVLPIAGPVLAWFASAYPRTADGTLRITPTQALETHWYKVENDLPTIAGLHWCLQRLRTLAPELVPEAQQVAWAALELALPPIPLREQDGARQLAPASVYDPSRQNCESPELYAVFPFRHYGLGKPDLEFARRAYLGRHDRFTNGWPQDGQDAALLGFLDDARANVLAKVQNHNRAHRFPAMWGPNFDWCPDQCHGSNLLDTVHRMLLQCDGDRILLLPCWPADWDVSFRLHAPQRTTVECVYRGGKVEKLVVTPPERRAAVVLPR